jgi:integration host factor subunit alpha
MPYPGTLTKAHIIDPVAERNGFTRKKSIETVEILLTSGGDVLIFGFGKFCVKKKKKRRGRNPATGENLMLAPRKRVTVQWSGKLREKLN